MFQLGLTISTEDAHYNGVGPESTCKLSPEGFVDTNFHGWEKSTATTDVGGCRRLACHKGLLSRCRRPPARHSSTLSLITLHCSLWSIVAWECRRTPYMTHDVYTRKNIPLASCQCPCDCSNVPRFPPSDDLLADPPLDLPPSNVDDAISQTSSQRTTHVSHPRRAEVAVSLLSHLRAENLGRTTEVRIFSRHHSHGMYNSRLCIPANTLRPDS